MPSGGPVWLVHKDSWKCIVVGGDEELAIDMAQIKWNETEPWPAETVEFEAELVTRPKHHPATIALFGWVRMEDRKEPEDDSEDSEAAA